MIRSSLVVLITLAWALWLGGLGALFLFVTNLFKSHPDIFHEAAPVLFHTFERYQIVLAIIALLATFAWRAVEKRFIASLLFGLFALATAAAVFNTIYITRAMDRIRLAGDAGSARFMSLHGDSMMIYSGVTFILLIAGCILASNIPGKIPKSQAAPR